MWQVLNPCAKMEPGKAPALTFAFKEEEIQDENSKLRPFRRTTSKDDFWTSAQIMNTTVFGYAYPETRKVDGESDDDHQKCVREKLACFYGRNVLQIFKEEILGETEHSHPENKRDIHRPKKGE